MYNASFREFYISIQIASLSICVGYNFSQKKIDKDSDERYNENIEDSWLEINLDGQDGGAE